MIFQITMLKVPGKNLLLKLKLKHELHYSKMFTGQQKKYLSYAVIMK